MPLVNSFPKTLIYFFVLPFKKGTDDPTRNSFNVYYMPLVEMKDFNELINNKPFFYQPVNK